MQALSRAAVLLLVAPTVLAVPARKWDELRSAHVPPTKISTLPLTMLEAVGLGGLFDVFGFGKDWLRIEGVDDKSLFSSQNFEFAALEEPYEWGATISSREKVRLRVGRSCDCELTGLAVYAKPDNTAWMRLHFESCLGCESTASRSAVVIPLIPSAGHDSNLLGWMCSLYHLGVCAPKLPLTEAYTSTTVIVTTLAPSPTSTSTQTTTTITPMSSECAVMSVRLEQQVVGAGICKGHTKRDQEKVYSARDCLVGCELMWLEQQFAYGAVDEMNRNYLKMNKETTVCKGYAYNEKAKLCNIYDESDVTLSDTSVPNSEDWTCYGHIHTNDKSFVMHQMETAGCMAPAAAPTSTETSTSTKTTTTKTATTTTRTTTITTTTRVEALNLISAFGAEDEEDAHVFAFPGDVHFQREGAEATLLQLQSTCFEAVDFYMLGSTLPIKEADWSSLMSLLTRFGKSEAAGGSGGRCSASATVDRIPVDVDFSRKTGSNALSTFGKASSVMLAVAFATLIGFSLAACAKSSFYGKDGVQPWDQHADVFMKNTATAIVAAGATFALVYALGLGSCWFASRVAAKQISMGQSGGLMLLSPTLHKNCLPMAGTAAGAAAVLWLWPSGQTTKPYRKVAEKDMWLKFNPNTGDLQRY